MSRFLLLSIFCLAGILWTQPASAQEGCQGEDLSCQLDWSGGTGKIIVPSVDEDGDTYPSTTVVVCDIDFGVGTGQVTGSPGEELAFPLPKAADAQETRATCHRQGKDEEGLATLATATLPPFLRPGAPLLSGGSE